MGVPFAKANEAAHTILSEAEYLRGVQPCDIFPDTVATLETARIIITEVLLRAQAHRENWYLGDDNRIQAALRGEDT